MNEHVCFVLTMVALGFFAYAITAWRLNRIRSQDEKPHKAKRVIKIRRS